jgi:transposase InsO family protein
MILALIEEAVKGGAPRARACAVMGLRVRTVERWRGPHPQDARQGPRATPRHALSSTERADVLALVNSPAYRDASPHQIVPQLADTGVYVASESTIYRLLREARQLAHRGRTQAPVRREVPAHHATGPQQVWSWDITYLKSPVRGVFWYLYLIMDIWSRRSMGWAVHPTQSEAHAAALFTRVCHEQAVSTTGLVLPADNGGPMKGATMLATLERLGVVPSFRRPRVSDDNPYSEALFRTLKYCPAFPTQPFVDLDAARAWVTAFVTWYNTPHQHSAIRFVTPDDRHTGRDLAILAQRATVYQTARATKPERWRGTTRDWSRPTTVYLNDARSATAALVTG